MMLKVGIAGISGRIGQRIIDISAFDDSLTIQTGLVSKHSNYLHDTINVSDKCIKSDVWIDFSTPEAFELVLNHCLETNTPLVSGTTGLSKKHFKEIENAALVIPVFWASNFAISVNLIQQLLSHYTQLRASDVEIRETHHVNKVDKPSGTAISLARSIKPHGILKTTAVDEFKLDDVVIKSTRDAQVAGIHQIELSNKSEVISITHTAKTPEIFAQGAVNVAKWLVNQKVGIHTMKSYIDTLS